MWKAYRERKEKALAAEGKGGKGKDTKGEGKGGKGKDSKGKGKGNKGKKGVDDKKAYATIAASASTAKAAFPEGAAGLDSWANVWLKHVEETDSGDWVELLTLADGTSSACKTTVGDKGVLEALVKKKEETKSIYYQCTG